MCIVIVLEPTAVNVVTLVPESGDDIQIMKAGLIEIADIYVINKYDREDSDKMYLFLRNMLSMIDKNKWIPSIVKTIAIKDFGISDLVKKISKHKKYLLDNNYMMVVCWTLETTVAYGRRVDSGVGVQWVTIILLGSSKWVFV